MTRQFDSWSFAPRLKELYKISLIILVVIIVVIVVVPCVLQCMQKVMYKTVSSVIIVQQKGGDVGADESLVRVSQVCRLGRKTSECRNWG